MTYTILSQITADRQLFSFHFSFDRMKLAKNSDNDVNHFLKKQILSVVNLILRSKHCLFVAQRSAKRKITSPTHLKIRPIGDLSPQSGNTDAKTGQLLHCVRGVRSLDFQNSYSAPGFDILTPDTGVTLDLKNLIDSYS